METPQEINVTIDNTLINHPYLDYMSESNRFELIHRLDNNASFICTFCKDKEILFLAAVDVHDGYLHVREVGGNFLRMYHILDIFVTGFAIYKNYDVVTFNTESKAVGRIAEKAKYFKTHENNEYLKRLH